MASVDPPIIASFTLSERLILLEKGRVRIGFNLKKGVNQVTHMLMTWLAIEIHSV